MVLLSHGVRAAAAPVDGEYRLINECSGKVMEVFGARTKSLIDVRLWTWSNELHQKWRLETLTDGTHRLVAKHSGLVLEGAGADLVDGVAVFQQREWRNYDNQRFLIEEAGGGWQRLRVAHNGLALTVRDGSTEDGAVIWQKPAEDSCAQRWKLAPVNDPGTPIDIQAVAGSDQTAPVGSRLRVRPAVRVIDPSGLPVADLPVLFTVLSGGGRITGGKVVTDANGVATIGGAWWLGPIPGVQKITASTPGLPEVVFSATASPIIGTGQLEPSPDANEQSGAISTALPVPPSVVVRAASTGLPVPGVTVTFAVTSGGGKVSNLSAISGLDGRATAGTWTMGDAVGLQTLEASAPGYGSTLFTATALPPAAPAVDREVFLTGVYEVWGMAFTPEGHLLYTERTRGLSVRLKNGTVRRLFAPPDMVGEVNSGMLGLVLDPQFATNRRAYVYMASNLGGVKENRVIRLVINTGYNEVRNRADIVTGISYQRGTIESGHHSGGQLAFDANGYLLISTGDARTGIVPQSPTELGGKVLRVDTKGFPAPGNMAPAGHDPRIFVTGVRNGHGIAVRKGDGAAFLIEHGTGRDDEINRLVAGGNGGWDPRPRPIGSPDALCPNGVRVEYCGYENTKMTNVIWYPQAMVPVWSSGIPARGSAGGVFIDSPAWGSWNGALAVSQLSGRRLLIMEMSSDGESISRVTPLLESYGARIRGVVQGPDGALYVSTSSDGNRNDRLTEVWRLVPRLP